MLKKIISLLLVLVLCFSITACAGEQGPKGDQGPAGVDGTAVTLVSLEKTKTEGLLDTYTMTFSDGTVSQFAVKNGSAGAAGTNGTSPTVGENGNWWIGELDTGVKVAGAAGTNGKDGVTPTIGENNNWWIDGVDTGVSSVGVSGVNGQTPFVGSNGNWWIGVKDTGVKAIGEDGGDGDDGLNAPSPHVGSNGNWWVGMQDLGVRAVAVDGVDGLTPYIGEDKNWWIGTENTGVKSEGTIPTIGDNGNWYINGTDTGVLAGVIAVNLAEKTSVTLHGSTETDRTYKITYSDDSYLLFKVITVGEKKSPAVVAFEVADGEYEGTLDDWIIDYANLAFERLASEGSVLLDKTLGAAIGTLINRFDEYFIGKQELVIYEELPLDHHGNINWNAGKTGVQIVEKVPLDPGEVRTMITYSGMENELVSAGSVKDSNPVVYQNTYQKGLGGSFAFNSVHIEAAQGNKLRVVNSNGDVVKMRILECFTKSGDDYTFKKQRYYSSSSYKYEDLTTEYWDISEGADGYVAGATHFRVGIDQYTSGSKVQEFNYVFTMDMTAALDVVTVNGILAGSAEGGMTNGEANAVVSTALGYPAITATRDTLIGGTMSYEKPDDKTDNTLIFNGDVFYLNGQENTVIYNKTLTFSAKLSAPLAKGEAIYVGHGFSNDASKNYVSQMQPQAGSYVKITDTLIEVYTTSWNGHEETDRDDNDKPVNRAISKAHGLKIEDYVNITIDNHSPNQVSITLSTPSGMYKTDSDKWRGRQGMVGACAVGSFSLTDLTLKWVCKAYSEKVWLYGDSYFDVFPGENPSRWPSYLINDGYGDVLLSSYSGMSTEACLEQFKQDVEYGTPQFVVWCCGMNNSDKNHNEINTGYRDATLEMLAICEEKGITPILCTIPNTPAQFHTAKNNWIKESGHRYIDFSAAVGGDRLNPELVGTPTRKDNVTNKTGAYWYDGMLNVDEIHPDPKGAAALYAQVLVDFPEITRKK